MGPPVRVICMLKAKLHISMQACINKLACMHGPTCESYLHVESQSAHKHASMFKQVGMRACRHTLHNQACKCPPPRDRLPHRRNDWIFHAAMIHFVKRQKIFKLFIRDEHSWASLNQNLTHLTLIGPSEVKVDLADFNLKLYENLLSALFKKNTY